MTSCCTSSSQFEIKATYEQVVTRRARKPETALLVFTRSIDLESLYILSNDEQTSLVNAMNAMDRCLSDKRINAPRKSWTSCTERGNSGSTTIAALVVGLIGSSDSK